MGRSNIEDNFDINKIGTGSQYTAGSFSSRTKAGLAGALRNMKSAGGRTYVKNLSKKDLGKIRDIIGEELSAHGTHAQGLSRSAQKKIMQKAEKLVQAGEFSRADKDDLKKIVGALAYHNQDRSSSSLGNNDPGTQKNNVSNRVTGVTPVTLATHSTDEITSKPVGHQHARVSKPSDENQTSKETSLSKSPEITLPATDKLPDMDIG